MIPLADIARRHCRNPRALRTAVAAGVVPGHRTRQGWWHVAPEDVKTLLAVVPRTDTQPSARRLTPGRLDWHARAACREVDPDLFFPERPSATATRAARTVCRRCPVLTDCRASAIEERFGIWAGMTEAERLDHRTGRIPDTREVAA